MTEWGGRGRTLTVIRVMIVDDALFMRKLYHNMLEKDDISIVAEAANGYEAIALYQETRPDVVLMDITMPGMPGIEALEEIMRIDPEARVIMSSAMGQEAFVRESVKKGARGFLVKPMVEATLLRMVRSVAQSRSGA